MKILGWFLISIPLLLVLIKLNIIERKIEDQKTKFEVES